LKGDIETSNNGKIEFMRTEFTEEIYVNEDVHCSETSVKSQDFNDFEMPIDISHLSVPNEMKHQIRTLFYNYTDVVEKYLEPLSASKDSSTEAKDTHLYMSYNLICDNPHTYVKSCLSSELEQWVMHTD
jgi:hypothetical protein